MIKNEEISNKLIKRGLSESSISNYLKNLKRLNDNKDIEDFEFLEDKDNILKKLEKYKPNTRRTYLISIVSILKADDPKSDLFNYYYDKMLSITKEIKKEDTSKLSDNQKENWMSWDEVNKVFNELKDNVLSFSKRGKLQKKQYENLLSLLITALYIYQEPRRNLDYQLLYKVKNYKSSFPDDKNYITDNNFIFNRYKTDKKYGSQKIPVSEELKPILELYYKQTGKPNSKPKIFLRDYEGKPLDKVNSITRILNSVFGRNIGSSLIRHIYLTDKYGKKLKEQKQSAENMGHSLQTQKEYIKDPNLEGTGIINLYEKIKVNFD